MKRVKEDINPAIVHIDLHMRIFRDTSSFASAIIDELGLWHKWLNNLKALVDFKGEVKGKAGVSMDHDIEN